jgi:hypothetical protein
MTIYIDVPVPEDRLREVFRLLSTAPLDPASDVIQPELDDDSEEAAPRDDVRWDAFWSVRENVTEHLVERSDLVHAILRAIAAHAGGDEWIVTDDIAADIGESATRVASGLGPLGRYLSNREIGWPVRWRFRDGDNKIEMQMAPEEAAVILDML